MSFTIEEDRHIFACWAASREQEYLLFVDLKLKKGKKHGLI